MLLSLRCKVLRYLENITWQNNANMVIILFSSFAKTFSRNIQDSHPPRPCTFMFNGNLWYVLNNSEFSSKVMAWKTNSCDAPVEQFMSKLMSYPLNFSTVFNSNSIGFYIKGFKNQRIYIVLCCSQHCYVSKCANSQGSRWLWKSVYHY